MSTIVDVFKKGFSGPIKDMVRWYKSQYVSEYQSLGSVNERMILKLCLPYGLPVAIRLATV